MPKFFDKNFYLSLIAGILHGFGFAPFNNVFTAIISLALIYFKLLKEKSKEIRGLKCSIKTEKKILKVR